MSTVNKIEQKTEPNQIIDSEFIVNSEEKKRILKQRAYLLKSEIKQKEEIGKILEGIEFLLGDEHYFIESKYVNEAIHMKELTPLPHTPSFFRGIINVRGKILAVICLKEMLNLPASGITNANKVILVKYQGIELGIIVDEIVDSYYVAYDNIQTEISGIAGARYDYLAGVTADGIIILNFEKFIKDDRIIINTNSKVKKEE